MKRIDPKDAQILTALYCLSCCKSALLELVENAVEANATRVQIWIGQDSLTVADNGSGISHDELLLLGEAQSCLNVDKLYSASRVWHSLVSLAHRVVIQSRPSSQINAFQKVFQDGVFESMGPVQSNIGTRITVEGLFAHVPARRRENRWVDHVNAIKLSLKKSSLMWPSVSFQFTAFQKPVLSIPVANSFKERFEDVFVKVEDPMDLSVSLTGQTLTGFVAMSKTIDYHFVFVNDILVQDDLVLKVMESCVSKAVKFGHSVCIMVMKCDAVQVMDSKTIIDKENTITKLIHQAFARKSTLEVCDECSSMCSQPIQPMVSLQPILPLQPAEQMPIPRNKVKREWPSVQDAFKAWKNPIFKSYPILSTKSNPANIDYAFQKADLEHFVVIGQAGDKFIICRLNSLLVAVDQHAADERVKVEHLIDEFSGLVKQWNRGSSDGLVSVPKIRVNVSIDEHEIKSIQKVGILGHAVSNGFVVTHVPILFQDRVSKEFVESLLQTHVEWLRSTDINIMPPHILDALNSIACRSAIMFGDTLNLEACQSLMNQLSVCKFPFQCGN